MNRVIQGTLVLALAAVAGNVWGGGDRAHLLVRHQQHGRRKRRRRKRLLLREPIELEYILRRYGEHRCVEL